MVYDSASLCAPVAEQGQAVETRISGEAESMSPVVADKVAYLRGKIGRGEYDVDLAAIAAAMLGSATRQISDDR